MLALGACEVYVDSPPPAAPRPPARQAFAPPTPPPPVIAAAAAPLPPRPAPPPPQPLVVPFPARVVRPPPLQSASSVRLDITSLRMKLRTNRKCGAREVPPNSGHYVHLDCNLHVPLATAKPFSPRKLNLMLAGVLKLDSPIAPAGAQPAKLDTGVDGALPDAVDHRKDGTEGPIEDQGQVGSCTAFSLASAMDNAIRRQNKADTMSPLHIWSHYGVPVIKNAGDQNLNKAIAAWDAWPYDERLACEIDQSGDGDCGPYLPPVVPGSAKLDPTVQAKVKDSDAKGRWRVTEYDAIAATPDTIAAILVSGADVWFTMDIGNSWLNPQGDTIPDWSEATIDGGHAVLFAGYRHKNGLRQFLVHNSWGKDWGDQGFAYVSEAMVKQFTKQAYKVVVSDSSPPPSPGDSNALTDDDCGEDQLVDSATGQCVTICPDDSRPANGQCDANAGAKKPVSAPHGLKLLKR